jgi:hypothetical protein
MLFFMTLIRLKPSQVIQVLTTSYTATQVDTAFVALLNLRKIHGRRKAVAMVQAVTGQDYEPMQIIYELLHRAVGRVAIYHLKRYQNLLRVAYTTSYATIAMTWAQNIDRQSFDALHSFLQQKAWWELNIVTNQSTTWWLWVRVTLNDAIYNRALEQDVDQLLRLI